MPMCSPAIASRCARPEIAEGRAVLRRDGARLPGQQRRGDRPLLGRDRGGDAGGDRLAQPLDEADRARRAAVLDQLGRAERVTVGAEAGVECVALQVPGTGIGGRRGAAQQGADAQRVARLDRDRVACPEPDADAARLGRAAVEGGLLEGDPLSGREMLDDANAAGRDHGMAGDVEQGGRPPGRELARGETRRKRRRCPTGAAQDRPGASQQSRNGREAEGGRTQERGRLGPLGVVDDHAGDHPDRQPKRETAPLGRRELGQQPAGPLEPARGPERETAAPGERAMSRPEGMAHASPPRLNRSSTT